MTNKEQHQADFLADEGKSFYQAKKYLPAADSFSRAAEIYAASGEPLKGAEMRNNQCVSLLQARKPQEALEAVKGTSVLFSQGGERVNAGMALANEAAALKDLGKVDSAVDKFSQAADIFQAEGKNDLYLETMQSISGLKLRSREIIGAVFSMQRGLDGVEKPTWRQKILKSLLKLPDKLLNK